MSKNNSKKNKSLHKHRTRSKKKKIKKKVRNTTSQYYKKLTSRINVDSSELPRKKMSKSKIIFLKYGYTNNNNNGRKANYERELIKKLK
jgi:hypothetical protein